MGNRYHIYVRIPVSMIDGVTVEIRPAVIGIQHRWLWGVTAMRLAYNFLRFADACIKSGSGHAHALDNEVSAMGALIAAYSFDAARGYYHAVQPLEKEEGSRVNPLDFPQDTGITILDVTGKRPKYCFMSLGGIHCLDLPLDERRQGTAYKNFEPIGAERWLRLHYSHWEASKVRIWTGPTESRLEVREGLRDDAAVNLIDLRGFDCLTLDEVKSIFPDMIPETATLDAEAAKQGSTASSIAHPTAHPKAGRSASASGKKTGFSKTAVSLSDV